MDVRDARVRDLMQHQVATEKPDTSLREAAHRMHERGVSSLVVPPMHPGDAFGILTRKDAVGALMGMEEHGAGLLVEDVMTKPALTVQPDLTLAHCWQLMQMVGVRRMPVVDSNQLVGLISNTDVFRFLAQQLD